MIRRAVAAGRFYEGDEAALREQITECFLDERGPGLLPEIATREERVKGCVVPHAGYVFSGAVAAHSYAEIAKDGFSDKFIIVGPNHTGLGSEVALMSEGEWETPLGAVPVDEEIAGRVVGGIVSDDAMAHLYEHSVEVQLPFLQFSLKSRAEKIKILPLLVSDDLDLDRASHDLKEALGKLRKKACFIVSSDFIHYGPNYGFTPFSRSSDYSEYSEGSGRSEQNPGLVEEKIKKIRELDMKAIDYIKQVDAHGFLNYIRETGATICGFLAIALFLKTVGFNRPVLEQYYTSGDVTGDYTNSVSYASLVFR